MKILTIEDMYSKLTDITYFTRRTTDHFVSITFPSNEKEYNILRPLIDNIYDLLVKFTYDSENSSIDMYCEEKFLEPIFCLILSVRFSNFVNSRTTLKQFVKDVKFVLNDDRFYLGSLSEPVC